MTEDNGEYLQHLLIGGELDVAVLLTSSVKDRMALHVETLVVSPYRLWLPWGTRWPSKRPSRWKNSPGSR